MESQTEREQRLSQKYPSKMRWSIFGTIMAQRFISMGLANGAFSLMLSTMITEMGMDNVQRAAIMSASSTGQLVATFVFGFLIDRISVKKLVGIGLIFVTSVVCFLRGVTTSYPMWLVIMFIWGLTYSSMLVGSMKIVGLWFTKKQMTDVTGYFTLSGPLGQLIAMQVSLTLISLVGGWQKYFMVLGILMFIVFILFMVLCKDRPNEDSEIPPSFDKKETGLIKDILAMIKVPRIWCLWLAEACEAAVITLATTYGQIVLQNDPKWGLEKAVSKNVSSLVMLGVVIGYFVIPKIIAAINRNGKNDRSMRLLTIFSIVSGMVASIVYLSGYLSYNYSLICVLAVIGGLGQAGFIVGPRTLTVAQPEVAGPRAGAATTVAQLLGRLGLVIVTAAIGALAVAKNDSASIMILLYVILFCGPLFLIAFLLIENAEKRKAAAGAAKAE